MSQSTFYKFIVFLLACYIFGAWVVVPLVAIYHICVWIGAAIYLAFIAYFTDKTEKGSKT